jgi:hypothetical protein
MIIQAEDDEGDSIEMSSVVRHLGLSDKDLTLVGQNTHIDFLNDKTGLGFTRRLDQMLELRPCELALINPLSAYLGDDTKDEKSVNQFLRSWMNPILTTRSAAAIFIHHTPKTTNPDTSEWRATDWMYAGSGVAGITNWARAYLVIEPTDTYGVFRFIAAKRGQRIGWGRPRAILGSLPRRDQIALAKERAKTAPEDILSLIPVIDPILQEELFLKAKERRIGDKKIALSSRSC